jgi:hypothetical protein
MEQKLRADETDGVMVMLRQAGKTVTWAMTVPIREPLITYLLTRAEMLRHAGASHTAADRLSAHARALELLAEFVPRLAEDDERLLTLATLAVRGRQFVPGPATEHALSQFTGSTVQECDAFLSLLSRVARDDALANARQHGFLPPRRPS